MLPSVFLPIDFSFLMENIEIEKDEFVIAITGTWL